MYTNWPNGKLKKDESMKEVEKIISVISEQEVTHHNFSSKAVPDSYILKIMFNQKDKGRKMKKIFQWREYLNWKNMTSDQKINLKRACLFPFLVYLVYFFLLKYSIAILLIIGIYYLIRFKSRKKINK